MTKREAMFFIEGLMVGLSGPPRTDGLTNLLIRQFNLVLADLDDVRLEVDKVLDEFDSK